VEAMLWSDPSETDGTIPNPRGTGVEFGPDIARKFMDRYGLTYIVRSHQPVFDGVEYINCGGERNVVTVFSAASYPDGEGSNLAAIVHLDQHGNCKARKFAYNGHAKMGKQLQKFMTKSRGKLRRMWTERTARRAKNEDQLSYEDTLASYIADNRISLEKRFHRLENTNGFITVQQWADTMESVLDIRGVPWLELQPRLAPTDQDNFIDWQEYLGRNSTYNLDALDDEHMALLHEHKDRLFHIFEFLDMSGNGSINRKEFKTGIEIINSRHLPKDKQLTNPEDLFTLLDRHHNGEIDIEEFSEIWSRSSVLAAVTKSLSDDAVETMQKNHEVLLAAFQYLDKDHDGKITESEFKACVDQLNERLDRRLNHKDMWEMLGGGECGIGIETFNQVLYGVA
jgi:Ca2+-binding EF-hand superfamily protein